MGDTETFKLVPFLIGNGCEQTLIRRWIMLAQRWADSTVKAEKRARQVDFVLNNAEQKSHLWFYFDVELQQTSVPQWVTEVKEGHYKMNSHNGSFRSHQMPLKLLTNTTVQSTVTIKY